MKKTNLFKLLLVAAFLLPGISSASDGALDRTFNTANLGVAFGANPPLDFQIQPDGKIVAVGNFTSYNGTAINRIARINTDGTLDTTFNPGTGANASVNTVQLQSDGKILIGGSFTTFDGVTRGRVARLNSDGSLDASYNSSVGTNGNVLVSNIQPDGKMLVGGTFTSYNGTTRGRIARINTDGTIDTSFTSGLSAVTSNSVNSIEIQSDGKILIAGGNFSSYAGTSRNRIARINSDGTLDTTFNPGSGFANPYPKIKLLSNGQIMGFDNITTYNGVAGKNLVRINSDGSLDTTFNAAGVGPSQSVTDVIEDPSGKIIIAGRFTAYNGSYRIRIARINANGTVDNSFYNSGTGLNSNLTRVALQSDGKIIASGVFTAYNGNYNGTTTVNRFVRLGSRADIVITAPTKVSNAPITNTTIRVTDPYGIDAAQVVRGTTTVGNSGFACVQTTSTQVDCTITITSSGQLTIRATNSGGEISQTTMSGYVFDTIAPSVPSVSVDTASGVNNPTITFSATDNIAVGHYEVDYNDATGTPQTINPATSPVSLTLDPAALTNAPFYHQVTVRVYDTAGNMSSSVVRFPPIVTFNAPTTIKNSPITNATVTITTPTGNDLTNISLTPNTTGATLGTCTGNDGGTTAPFKQPVNCVISNISATGTLSVSAQDVVTTATGLNNQSFVIETATPSIVISASTKASGTTITNTTVTVTDDTLINPAGVVLSLANVTGGISLNSYNCTAVNNTEVSCTLVIGGTTGTADLRVTATDVAGNQSQLDETGYSIDTTPPTTPAASPDLQAASDTGSSSTDNITNNTAPNFTVMCTEVGSTITLYANGANQGGITCSAIGPTTVSVSPALADGSYIMTYTETDTFGNQSAVSPSLSVVIIDATAPTTPGIQSVGGDTTSPYLTNDNTPAVVITTELGDTVTIPGFTCTPTPATGTTVTCTLTTPYTDGTHSFTPTITDQAGNSTVGVAVSVTIDTLAPTPLATVNSPAKTDLTGTAEAGATVVVTTLSGATCTTTALPDGTWSCTLAPEPIPGEDASLVTTDAAGNSTTLDFNIYKASGGSVVNYVCKDPQATNYESFGRHKPSLCKYSSTTTTPVTPTTDNPFGGEQCPSNLLITDNMKNGDTNGVYSSYNKGKITQVSILQAHINRLLKDEYTQAAGPVDDFYRSKTKLGVERIQRKLNQLLPNMKPLVIDGIVGPFTKKAINMSC
jgi:uncharacterized delta-60 repeat protein